MTAFEPRVDPADRKEKQRKRKIKGVIPGNNPKTGFDMRTEVYKLFGVDVTQIPGLMAAPAPPFRLPPQRAKERCRAKDPR